MEESGSRRRGRGGLGVGAGEAVDAALRSVLTENTTLVFLLILFVVICPCLCLAGVLAHRANLQRNGIKPMAVARIAPHPAEATPIVAHATVVEAAADATNTPVQATLVQPPGDGTVVQDIPDAATGAPPAYVLGYLADSPREATSADDDPHLPA